MSLILHTFPPLWGIPSPSPFCVKLGTWLRMVELPHETDHLTRPPRSRTGKVPYVTLEDGAPYADSGRIIAHLTEALALTIDDHLDPDQRQTAHLIRRTVEESLYFVVVYMRWVPDDAFAVTREGYFAPVPKPLRRLVAAIVRRQARGYVWGQGIARHHPDDVWAMGAADLAALAQKLGDREYFFGAPSSTDAVVYGCLENIRLNPVVGPLQTALEGHANLVAHCQRMRARYWPELDGASGSEETATVEAADQAA